MNTPYGFVSEQLAGRQAIAWSRRAYRRGLVHGILFGSAPWIVMFAYFLYVNFS